MISKLCIIVHCQNVLAYTQLKYFREKKLQFTGSPIVGASQCFYEFFLFLNEMILSLKSQIFGDLEKKRKKKAAQSCRSIL